MMHDHIHNVGVRVADSAAAGSITAATWINLADAHLIVQIVAGIVAIIAGLSAAAYHIYKTYELHQARKNKGQESE